MKTPFDPRSLHLDRNFARIRAEMFRKEVGLSAQDVPVDIEMIVEERLGLEVIPIENLSRKCDLTAGLSQDLSSIYVDKAAMLEPRKLFNYRFSLAHEIGHLYVHRPFFDWLARQGEMSIEEWLVFVRRESELAVSTSMESSANEFAGRLLVPRLRLEESLSEAIEKAREGGLDLLGASNRPSDQDDRDYLGTFLHRKFEVSAQVMAIRLQVEGLYP